MVRRVGKHLAEANWTKRIEGGQARCQHKNTEIVSGQMAGIAGTGVVSLQDYSIDDLHAMATAELDADADAVSTLHALYVRLLDEYVAAYLTLRERSAS